MSRHDIVAASGLHSSQDGSDIIVDRPGKQEIARKMAMIKDYLRQKGFDVLQRRTVRLYCECSNSRLGR